MRIKESQPTHLGLHSPEKGKVLMRVSLTIPPSTFPSNLRKKQDAQTKVGKKGEMSQGKQEKQRRTRKMKESRRKPTKQSKTTKMSALEEVPEVWTQKSRTKSQDMHFSFCMLCLALQSNPKGLQNYSTWAYRDIATDLFPEIWLRTIWREGQIWITKMKPLPNGNCKSISRLFLRCFLWSSCISHTFCSCPLISVTHACFSFEYVGSPSN